VFYLEKQDYRVRTVDVQTTPEIELALETINKGVLGKVGKNEAALLDNRILVLVNENLKDYSFITTNIPNRSRIDYVSRITEKVQQENLTRLKEEYDLNQGQLNRITKQYKRRVNEFERELQEMVYEASERLKTLEHYKEKLIEEITIEVVNDDQLNKWRNTFERHYEGIIKCLCIENNSSIPAELKKEIDNKREILFTYFEDFINTKVD
jgi:transposase-like protein